MLTLKRDLGPGTQNIERAAMIPVGNPQIPTVAGGQVRMNDNNLVKQIVCSYDLVAAFAH